MPLLLPHPLLSHLQAIKGQSLKIVGSVDLLGNPTGLVSDIASGVSGMMSHSPDVVGLLRDLTHGITDSTSKVGGGGPHPCGSSVCVHIATGGTMGGVVYRYTRTTNWPDSAYHYICISLYVYAVTQNYICGSDILEAHCYIVDEDKAGLLVRCRKAVLSCTNCYKFGDILEAHCYVVDN